MEVSEADMRLIAAAPDLLDACAGVWCMLADTGDNELRLIADECRAAISKATGAASCLLDAYRAAVRSHVAVAATGLKLDERKSGESQGGETAARRGNYGGSIMSDIVDRARKILTAEDRTPDADWLDLTEAMAAEITRLRERNAEMLAALKAIRAGTISGKVGPGDVVWFDEITTLHDFCDEHIYRAEPPPSQR